MPGWWRRRSLRARLTVATTAGLAIALLAAAMLLRSTLRASLIDGLDNTARQGAREVAALADHDHLPDPVPVAAGTLTVQVLAPDGRIMAASPGADRLVPLLPPRQAAADARAGRAVLLDGRPFGVPYLLRVVAVQGRAGETVLAGVDFQSVNSSVSVLGRALLVGTPLLLLLLAWATWLVVGSALRPIAALRRGAQEVTATGQPRALPVPEARDEVHSLAVTLNDMLARLDAAQRRQRGLISDTAHELRSPIASIRAQLEVALDHPEQQDWQETTSDVLADTLRLARLAEDLLLLARLDECGDSGGVKAAGSPVDLAALAAEEAGRATGGRVPVRALTTEPPVPDGTTGVAGVIGVAVGMGVTGTTGADRRARVAVNAAAAHGTGPVTDASTVHDTRSIHDTSLTADVGTTAGMGTTGDTGPARDARPADNTGSADDTSPTVDSSADVNPTDDTNLTDDARPADDTRPANDTRPTDDTGLAADIRLTRGTAAGIGSSRGSTGSDRDTGSAASVTAPDRTGPDRTGPDRTGVDGGAATVTAGAVTASDDAIPAGDTATAREATPTQGTGPTHGTTGSAEDASAAREAAPAGTSGLFVVNGDADGLRRVLVNLIENALRYAKSRVDVAVARDGGDVLVRVTDDGQGIPEADRERVFGRFIRLDDARSRDDDGTEGAGLGLAIVRATAQAHGGSAWLEDAGPGLRAVVRLPAATSRPTAAAR